MPNRPDREKPHAAHPAPDPPPRRRPADAPRVAAAGGVRGRSAGRHRHPGGPMTDRNFALPPIGKAATVFALVFAAGIPLIVAVSVLLQARAGQLHPAVGLATLGLVGVVVLAVVLPMWRRRVACDGRRVRVEATYYKRETALADLDLDAERVVALRDKVELRPFVKTNGVGLPGFQAGHFRLRDWRRKAFCMVSDPA